MDYQSRSLLDELSEDQIKDEFHEDALMKMQSPHEVLMKSKGPVSYTHLTLPTKRIV